MFCFRSQIEEKFPAAKKLDGAVEFNPFASPTRAVHTRVSVGGLDTNVQSGFDDNEKLQFINKNDVNRKSLHQDSPKLKLRSPGSWSPMSLPLLDIQPLDLQSPLSCSSLGLALPDTEACIEPTHAANNKDKNEAAMTAYWRYQKASCFSKVFGGLRAAVGQRVPPPLPYSMEHCGYHTYKSRDSPADLLTSLCFAMVCADVHISNQKNLMTGKCWVVQGFFFAMYRRTCVHISVFTSQEAGTLMVELQCLRGDRGACDKLCNFIKQYCRLLEHNDNMWLSCPTSQRTAIPESENTHDQPPVDSQRNSAPVLMRGSPQTVSANQNATVDVQFDEANVQESLYVQNNEDERRTIFSESKPQNSVAKKAQCANITATSPRSITHTPPAQPLKLHLCKSFQPLPLPDSIVKKMKFEPMEDTEENKTLLESLIELQAETVYRDGKLNFWQDIASVTSTDPSAAREFMSLCVKSCDDKSDIKILDSIVALLERDDSDFNDENDLQYCVLASFFNATQAEQQDAVSVLNPEVMGPIAAVVQAATKFTDEKYGRHLRVHAVGVIAWFTCQQATASISCGAALSISLPKFAGNKTSNRDTKSIGNPASRDSSSLRKRALRAACNELVS